jgi:hypothetical protein
MRRLAAEEVIAFFGAAGLLVLGIVLSATLHSQAFCWGGLALAAATYAAAMVLKPRRFRTRVQGSSAEDIAKDLGTSVALISPILVELARALRTDPSRIALGRTLGAYADDVAFLLETDEFADLREAFSDLDALRERNDEALAALATKDFLKLVLDQRSSSPAP